MKSVFQDLDRLDKRLRYHGKQHTTNDVLPNSITLANEEGLSDEEVLIVKTAALYHDVGYLDQYDKNEPLGVQRAKNDLPRFGYSNEQVEKISACIMATQVPQQPKSKLEQIVCDADLSSLGSEHFYIASEWLRLELNEIKNLGMAPREWLIKQLSFLQGHQYWTESAKRLYGSRKDQHIREIKELLGLK